MKNNRLNMHNTSNLTILQNQTTKNSLKNIVFLPLISILLVFGLNANSYAATQKTSMTEVLANVSQIASISDSDAQKFQTAMTQEDRQQLRDEMRQQWNGNNATDAQKNWKQLGAEDREQLRRDMVRTVPAELPAPAAGVIRR